MKERQVVQRNPTQNNKKNNKEIATSKPQTQNKESQDEHHHQAVSYVCCISFTKSIISCIVISSFSQLIPSSSLTSSYIEFLFWISPSEELKPSSHAFEVRTIGLALGLTFFPTPLMIFPFFLFFLRVFKASIPKILHHHACFPIEHMFQFQTLL